jgi:hypothetical protein
MSHRLGPHGILLSCLAKDFVVRSKDAGELVFASKNYSMPGQNLLFGKELALVGQSELGLLLPKRHILWSTSRILTN